MIRKFKTYIKERQLQNHIFVFILLLFGCSFIFLYSYIYKPVVVNGVSMQPTLTHALSTSICQDYPNINGFYDFVEAYYLSHFK